MKYETMLFYIVFTPLIFAFILPVIGKISLRLRNLTAFFSIAASFILSLALIPEVLKLKTVEIAWQFPLGFNFILRADCLAVFMACVSSLISAIIALFSFDYISHYENQNEYYCMVVLFLGAMMGLVFSANLIFLYIFWEITAITSWRLIGFFRHKEYVFKADKSFLITMFGALAMLLGFIFIFQETRSFDLAIIKEVLKTSPLSNVSVILILAGIFAKSATLPFQTWLPDAGVAPSPVTALLHAAVLVKIGVYAYARLFLATFTFAQNWHIAVAVIAGFSALIAAGMALRETDLKRIIAYSTISQIGFIFLGFSVNNQIGILGALLFILMHGLAKAGLFLSAGIIEQNAKSKDITKLGGLIKCMPVTAVCFLLCAFSVMGIPPLGGFFSKYLVFSGAISAGHLFITLLYLVTAFLTILYLFRLFNLIFLGEPQLSLSGIKEKSPLMVSSVALLAFLSLISGVLIYYPAKFGGVAAQQMLGWIK